MNLLVINDLMLSSFSYNSLLGASAKSFFHFRVPCDRLHIPEGKLELPFRRFVRQFERPGWAGLGFHFWLSADKPTAQTGLFEKVKRVITKSKSLINVSLWGKIPRL